ncbi:MAG: RecQ family ATP-dependent DNA helicase [Akkermansiaceae bacterium]
MDPTEALKIHFGHRSFRDGQLPVIESLLADRSALAVFPTGGGKSLCYQLPALLFDGLTLVVSPLIALMKDQVDALTARNIHAARLDSSLTAEETAELYRRLDDRSLKLLYVAPERLANQNFRRRLSSLKISLLAIDEAHCMSSWGHNFRPDYLKLRRFAQELEIPRVLCLTATATPQVSQDICEQFEITPEDHHQLTFYRPNLNLVVTPLSDQERRPYLLKQLTDAPRQSTIVYTTLQHSAESLASYLKKNGINARPYHAGLRPEARVEIQEAFMSGKLPVICATIAFGMGIDKPDIRAIYHYNLPKSPENYSQEIGRAGRDGNQARCELLACHDDLRTLANFTYGDTPQPDPLRSLLRIFVDQPGEFDISTYELSQTHDIRPLVINTVLTYLELEGLLEATAPFYSTYKVSFARDLDHLLKGFDPQRQEFLRRLFETAKKGYKWLEIDPEQTASQLGNPKEKIVETISYLEDLGDLAVKPAGLRQGYRLRNKPNDLKPLIQRLIDLFQQREKSDLARLQQVIDYALEPGCLYSSLLSLFSETIPPCGHCSHCLGTPVPQALPSSPEPEISNVDLELIQNLIGEKHPGLRTPRQLARFLCGITSPATSRTWYLPAGARRKQRLTSHDAYALLENHDFQSVLDQCELLIID